MPQVSLSELIAGARSGESLISFPTDTLPALASRPDRAGLIFAAKQRSQTKPLILMGADMGDLWDYVQGSAIEMQIWQAVAARHLPGALTLVLPASDRLPNAMNPSDPTTIGIRVPNCAIAQYILSQTQPLATTSVNRSGEPPLQTIPEIESAFPDVLTLSPDAFQELMDLGIRSQLPELSTPGIPSTVAKWTGETWQILRQGVVDILNPGIKPSDPPSP